ncbi:dTDP-4-dehydrorhamnose 3,5-epimerase [Camelimonas abortus]|uniref:dTDP-4-dehydrorhamnose 3,5-epimerase n=1 Tax=Camelimonas abortus TaxID=1017184 RepID=A0ABV7LCI6_9HYPH
MVSVVPTEIPDVKIITPRRFADERGFFSETWNSAALKEAGLDLTFVQDNHSLSRPAGTVRGLHFQSAPFAQGKLVRVPRGRILDVAVDLRRSSPTYGRHVAVELSAGNWRQLWIPVGFAHGFCTLEPDTEVIYKVTAPYSAAHDHGVLWNDPDLAIDWPVAPENAVLSAKDRNQPRFRDLQPWFG